MASLRAAIKSKCIDCTYDKKAPGTALFQIENCTIKSCPLWLVRPLTIATINLNRELKTTNIDNILDNLEDE